MKKMSKADQRKLLNLYEAEADRSLRFEMQVNMDWGKDPDEKKLREKRDEKISEFKSFLEKI